MLWGVMKFMIWHDKEVQNEGKTMAPACGIYESFIITMCVLAKMLLNSLGFLLEVYFGICLGL